MSGQTMIERLRCIRGRAVEYVEWRKAGFPMTDERDTYPDDLYSAAVRAEAMVPLLDEVLAALSHPAVLLRLEAAPPEPAEDRKALAEALHIAEAALADIGDADREPGDDVAWCEARAAQALPAVRAALNRLAGLPAASPDEGSAHPIPTLRLEACDAAASGGWCAHCGCGNDGLGYAHAPLCQRQALAELLDHCAKQGWWLESHAVKAMDRARAALAAAPSPASELAATDEVLIAIKRPDDYADVAPELVAQDFIDRRGNGFEWRVVEQPSRSEKLRDAAKSSAPTEVVLPELPEGEAIALNRVEDARDAARYRQIRRGQRWSVYDGIGDVLRADALDAAIDKAMAEKEGA